MKQAQPRLILVFSAIMLASVLRVLPHWPNFTPMAAMALMGGTFIRDRRIAFFTPLVALFISDILTIQFINHQWTSVNDFFLSPATWLLYMTYILMTIIGLRLQKNPSAFNISLSALSCSLLFFIASNFGVWLVNELPKNLTGLAETYMLGIPFFGYDLAGSLFYSFIFFGAFKVVCERWPSLNRKPLMQ